ncbi:signal peptide peptidase SppA [Glaciecola sp. 1036]|uniref:signal peptide peptidase SppA n=1 Tax=Alteromonadaceae TaxID=72275 RepID=UPI003D05BFEA
MSEKSSITKSIFVGAWTALNFSRRLVLNILFIIILIAIIIAISSGDSDKITVNPSSALVLDLNGDLVVQKKYVDPVETFVQEAAGQQQDNPEILVRDLVKVIKNAKDDNRIKVMILRLQGLGGGGLDKLRLVADAIEDFKTSGKPVYAINDFYSRNQYYLAAHADNVYVHPMGGLLMEGYAYYGNYFKDGLDKIKATTHVFKVGKFKSAVEPYTRNDMSPEAKEANSAWLNELWDQYKTDVAAARGFSVDNFDETFEQVLAKFREAKGDFAEYALNNKWVDGLRSREEFRSEMTALLGEGEDDKPYNAVSFKAYLDLITPAIPLPDTKGDKVAIVVAKGSILDGTQKPGTIGGDSTAALLKQAREDENVKAVVLQVDSGGGSAFASEVIRKEIDLIKESGKPVIASMATYAASGGYWISVSADYIVSEPSTITGSIGIFGMFTTFENSFNYIGINSDGVSTNELNGIAADRPLAPGYGELIQMNIERGYDRFITLVATERNMTKEAVDQIAQGRVWIGTQALELGLVDELGDLEFAVNKAAELAGITDFETKYIEPKMSEKDMLLQKLFKASTDVLGESNIGITLSPVMQMAFDIEKDLKEMTKLNDPMASYVLCLECKIQ